MRPHIACANHPDSEGFFQCRYCGGDFCGRCVHKEEGFYRCNRSPCVKVFRAHQKIPRKPVPTAAVGIHSSPHFESLVAKNYPSFPKKESDSPVTVARFASVAEANLAKSKLAGYGIGSFVADEAVGSLYSKGNTFLEGIRLQVRTSDAEKVLKILDSLGPAHPKRQRKTGEPAGACRYCGKILNLKEAGREPGPLHCRKAGCRKAYRAEMKRLTRACPFCGTKVPYPQAFCGKCGAKIPEIQLELKQGTARVLVAPVEKWDFGSAFLLWLALVSVENIPGLIFSGSHFLRGLLPDTNWLEWIFLLSLAPCLLLAVYWTRRFQSLSWLGALRHLGYKAPNPRQLLAAILILVPILAGDFLGFQAYQQEGVLIQLKTRWVLQLWHILLGAGLFEETIYRGFLFRFLRRGRSFFSAAALTSLLWAITHLYHAMPIGGPWHDDAPKTLVLLFQVFVDGMVGAFVFERGGYNIWGWMLAHIGIDISSLLNVSGGDFYVSSLPENWFDLGRWISVGLTVPIVLWVLPRPVKDGVSEEKGGKKPIPFLGNALVLRWKSILLPFVLASGFILSLFLISAQRLSERADENDWKKLMDSHSRYAGGYRKWAHDLWELDKDGAAVEKCRQALAMDPKNGKTWLLWGRILWDQKNYGDAAEKFRKAAEYSPKNAAVYLWWGYALEHEGKKEEAIQKYRMVLALHPDETAFMEYAGQKIDELKNAKLEHG